MVSFVQIEQRQLWTSKHLITFFILKKVMLNEVTPISAPGRFLFRCPCLKPHAWKAMQSLASAAVSDLSVVINITQPVSVWHHLQYTDVRHLAFIWSQSSLGYLNVSSS